MKTKFTFIIFFLAICLAGFAQKPTTKLPPVVYTMGHDSLGSHNFNLYGAINANGDNAAFSFVYSADSTFATSITTPVQNKVIDTLEVVWATVNGLTASTRYFYYLTATTSGGTINGAHKSFFSDNIPFLFENMGADIYDPTYAELNGKARGFQNNIALSFEYGLTPALGLTVASNLATVSDANSHEFKGYLSTLTPGTLYFFRVKAISATDTLYTDIKAFYMGNPFSIFQALPVANITSSSADILAQVQGFKVPVKMKSEINGGNLNHYHTPYVYYDVTTSLINYDYNAVNLLSDSSYSVRIKTYSWIGSYYITTSFTTLTTGVVSEENSVNNVLTYPVPAKNYLTVELKNELSSESNVQLYNLTGQLVKEINMPAYKKSVTIDLNDILQGVYQLKLVSGNLVLNKNIIVLK